MISRLGRTLLAAALCLTAGGVQAPASDASIYEQVRKRISSQSDPVRQARELAEMVWLDPDTNPAATAYARDLLIGYGQHAVGVLGSIAVEADPIYTADIQLALNYARLQITAMRPSGLLSASDNVLWFGSVDAKRLAIPFLAEVRYRPSLLGMIDAAYEHEELIPTVTRALPAFREDRARFFLGDVLTHAERLEDKRSAALALARIGGRCIDTLRDGMLSDRPEVRKLSVEALLPHTGIDSLTALYEYMMQYPDDDPQLLEGIRARAQQLESLLEAQSEYEAAGSID